MLTMPEGVVVTVADTVPSDWTAARVADLVRANGHQLTSIGKNLAVKVQTTYGSFTTGVASQDQNGVYTDYQAIIYLDARSTAAFLSKPEFTIAHEYGHFWSNTWMYLKHNGSTVDWQKKRGVYADTRIGSTFNWTPSEMLADDYRLLFGTQTAQDQAGPLNWDIADARAVGGLRDWFISGWA
jgi:hypothetical protein